MYWDWIYHVNEAKLESLCPHGMARYTPKHDELNSLVVQVDIDSA